MFCLILASALLGRGDFAADIRNAEDFVQLKAEVAQLKAEVAELKARCKCAESAKMSVGGNDVSFSVDPPSNCATCQKYAATYKSTPTKTVAKTVCSGGQCSSFPQESRMIVYSDPVTVDSWGAVSGGRRTQRSKCRSCR